MCPCGNKLETFPLPNGPDSETITADQQGPAKPDFHLDSSLEPCEPFQWLSGKYVCFCEKLQQSVTDHTVRRTIFTADSEQHSFHLSSHLTPCFARAPSMAAVLFLVLVSFFNSFLVLSLKC